MNFGILMLLGKRGNNVPNYNYQKSINQYVSFKPLDMLHGFYFLVVLAALPFALLWYGLRMAFHKVGNK